MLFAVVPTIAEQLGFDVAATDRTLLPAMEQSSETAARVVRDRVLVEPTHWFIPPETTPALRDVAAAVWEAREAVLTYRGEPVRVRPLGLILKGDKWYLLAGAGLSDGRRYRLFRMSRVADVELSDHRFDRPVDFDLARAWTAHREAFLASLAELLQPQSVAGLLAPIEFPIIPVTTAADARRWLDETKGLDLSGTPAAERAAIEELRDWMDYTASCAEHHPTSPGNSLITFYY